MSVLSADLPCIASALVPSLRPLGHPGLVGVQGGLNVYGGLL